MKIWIFWFILLFAVFIESVYSSFPLVFDVLLLAYILTTETIVFPAAFIAGFLLDVMLVQSVGTSSIFFLVFLLFVMAYQRKFEIKTYQFPFSSSLFGGILFLYLFNHQYIFIQALLNAVFVVVVWRFIKRKFLI